MIATAVLAADYAGTLDLLDTTRAAARASQPAPIVRAPPNQGKVIVALDLSTMPAVRLHLSDRRWESTVSYSPSLTAYDVELGVDAQVVQAGSASVGWHDHFARLTLSEGATYGRVNTAYLYPQQIAPQQTTPPQTMTPQPMTGQPTAGSAPALAAGSGTPNCSGGSTCAVDFGSSDTSASLSLRTGRRSTLFVTGGYVVSGGLTAFSELVVPKQYGPRAAVQVAHFLSRRDALETGASAQQFVTSGGCPLPLPPTQFCSEHAAVFQVQETLHHQLSPAATLLLSAGASASLVEVPREEVIIQPVGLATYARRLDEHGLTSLNLSAQLGPVVDIRTGIPTGRFQAGASFSNQVAPRSSVVVSAGMIQSVPIPQSDPYPLTVLNGGVEARIGVDRRVDVGVGAVETWQNQPGYGTVASTICYVSLTARAPTVRF